MTCRFHGCALVAEEEGSALVFCPECNADKPDVSRHTTTDEKHYCLSPQQIERMLKLEGTHIDISIIWEDEYGEEHTFDFARLQAITWKTVVTKHHKDLNK